MKSKQKNNEGMTFPELILAFLMLTAFTGVTVIVTQYTSTFLKKVNDNSDVMNDFVQLNFAFDSIIEILSEPGIDKNTISDFTCTNEPSTDWTIPSVDDKAIPDSYKICLDEILFEDDLQQLVSDEDANPGIYILYSKIKKQSISTIPVRRIFCRPKPFCVK